MNAKLLLAALVALSFSIGSAKADEPSIGGLLKKATKAKQAKDFEAAIGYYDTVLSREKENMDAIRGMAWIRNDQEKFELALYWVKEGLAVDPNDGDLLTEGGYAAWKLGKTKTAKQYLVSAIKQRPKVATAYNYLIDILKEEGEKKAAREVEALRDENEAK